MKRAILVASILLTAIVPGTHATAQACNSELDQVVAGQNALACDLYQQMGGDQSNVFFSPASISLALAMTYGGAQGQTALEMAQALHFPTDQNSLHTGNHALHQHLVQADDGPAAVTLANSLWPSLELTLKDSFLDLCASNYGTRPQGLDFEQVEAARRVINAWVARNTDGLIPELLLPEDLTRDVLLVLANAIHFKATWKYRFDPALTTDRPFYPAGGPTIQVPTMKLDATLLTARIDGAQVVQLPYAGGKLAMTLVVPDDRDGLAALEAELDAATLARWLAELREQEISLALPRFAMSQRQELTPLLRSLGMVKAFAQSADFGGMAEGTLFVGKVVHEAAIELDEQGTEAAASTAVAMLRTCVRPTVRADHPFLFLINDLSSGAILFLGRMSNPSV